MAKRASELRAISDSVELVKRLRKESPELDYVEREQEVADEQVESIQKSLLEAAKAGKDFAIVGANLGLFTVATLEDLGFTVSDVEDGKRRVCW